jgi:hypothetical protein
LGQVTSGTAAQFGYSQSDMLDPDKNLDATAQYLAQQLKATGGNAAAAYERFHYGPGSGTYNDADAGQFERIRGQYSNVADATDAQGRTAEGKTASLSASRYADANLSPVADAVVAAFRNGAEAVNELSDAAKAAARSLHGLGSMPGATQRMPGGFLSPDGMWAPLTSANTGGALK